MVETKMPRILPAGKRGENKFPRSERLHRQRDFERCVKAGKVFRGHLLTLYAYWHGENMRRVAFSVGKAVGNAVLRNRIKRWLREAYRTRRWLMKEGVDLLFIVHRDCSNASYDAIDSEFEQLLLSAGVVDEKKLMLGGVEK
jgi:ribonuclease P protein component